MQLTPTKNKYSRILPAEIHEYARNLYTTSNHVNIEIYSNKFCKYFPEILISIFFITQVTRKLKYLSKTMILLFI